MFISEFFSRYICNSYLPKISHFLLNRLKRNFSKKRKFLHFSRANEKRNNEKIFAKRFFLFAGCCKPYLWPIFSEDSYLVAYMKYYMYIQSKGVESLELSSYHSQINDFSHFIVPPEHFIVLYCPVLSCIVLYCPVFPGYKLKSLKELSFCHNLWFSNLYIFVTQCRRP